jgi:type II secretory pathway pseudopilin PulG
MIEMIGVLAVLAILATIIISSTPRQLDIAAANLEGTNLVNYATALQNSILRNRYIPGTNDVIQVIATELGMDAKDVSTNSRNNPRIFVFDPGWAFYTNDALNAVSLGPLMSSGRAWQQGIGGAFMLPNGTGQYGGGSNNPPYKPRLMILSNLGTVPLALPSGFDEGDFAARWDAADGTVPTGGHWAWGGNGDDMRVQRINLTPLFVHVILYNYNYPTTVQGRYAIDRDKQGSVTNIVPNGTYGVDTYFIRGTILGLLKSAAAGGTLDADQILNRDTSFAYVEDVWRSSINLGEGIDPRAALMGNALWATAATFMGSRYYTNAVNGVTPPIVVSNMANFMSNYIVWATNNFPLSGSSYVNASNAQVGMIAAMKNMVGATWQVQGSKGTFQLNITEGACSNAPAQ